MRRRLLLVAATLASAAGFGLVAAPDAGAVCGGGLPGQPCYCPPSVDTSDGIKNIKIGQVHC